MSMTDPPSTSTASPDSSTREERRRREVIDAARRVIIRTGLEATTLRKVAREGGFTTGVVSHYFPDKRSVIVACFEAASADWLSSVESTLARKLTARDRIAALMKVALPTERRRHEEWRLWSEMWTYAGENSEFARTLVKTDARWERIIRDVLKDAQDDGILDRKLNVAAEARLLARLIDGLGLRAWLSGDWDEARRSLAYHLTALGAPSDDLMRTPLVEEKEARGE